MTIHRCPDCTCSPDEQPPPPAVSSTWAREDGGFCHCSAKIVAHRHLGAANGREATDAERAGYRRGGLL